MSLSALKPTAAHAFKEVSTRSSMIEDIFNRLGVDKARWTTQGVSVRKERDWVKDRYVDRGHRATNQITVNLDDFALAGKVIQATTEDAGASIDGPWWKIALDNPARTNACRQAAVDARRKAEAYADALGLRLGKVLSVTEAGLEEYRERSGNAMVLYDAAPELTINPGELDISAEIVATFALEGSS